MPVFYRRLKSKLAFLARFGLVCPKPIAGAEEAPDAIVDIKYLLIQLIAGPTIIKLFLVFT